MKSILDTTQWRYNPAWSLLDPLEAPLWNDPRVSAKSKGVWGYMKSKPYGWDFSAERMARNFTDGKKAIQSAFIELEEAGYLSRTKLKTGRVSYTLVDDPWVGVEPTVEKSPLAKYHVFLDGRNATLGGTQKDAVDAIVLAYSAYYVTKAQATKAIDGRVFDSYAEILEWMNSDKNAIDEALELPLSVDF